MEDGTDHQKKLSLLNAQKGSILIFEIFDVEGFIVAHKSLYLA